VELSSLRRDLLGDRRTQANRSAFDAIHPTIDHLYQVHDSLDESADGVRGEVSAALSSLKNVLRGLGYAEFAVEVGAPFDPARMECVEYAEGEPGVVLELVRPGYRADDVIVRPCGVRIADPSRVADDRSSSLGATDE
jgi:molecular chaperone GrpE